MFKTDYDVLIVFFLVRAFLYTLQNDISKRRKLCVLFWERIAWLRIVKSSCREHGELIIRGFKRRHTSGRVLLFFFLCHVMSQIKSHRLYSIAYAYGIQHIWVTVRGYICSIHDTNTHVNMYHKCRATQRDSSKGAAPFLVTKSVGRNVSKSGGITPSLTYNGMN